MNIEQIEPFVGMPYRAGSYGPDDFNCWGLLYYIQKNYFNVEMPFAPIGNEDACRLLFKERIEAGVWAVTDNPLHGDGVLMRPGSNPHVGVYLDIDGGGILHALEGFGVVFTATTDLSFYGFGRVKYYRLNNGDQSCNSS